MTAPAIETFFADLPHGTRLLCRAGGPQGAPTIPAERPAKKIDYIFLSKNAPWSVGSTVVLNQPIASDHRPVLAEFTWPTEGKP